MGGNSPEESAAKAAACFAKSLEVAEIHGLRSFQLRTLTSIHRHRLTEMVSNAGIVECYAWFKEGFETADLIDARVVIDQQGTQQRAHAD